MSDVSPTQPVVHDMNGYDQGVSDVNQNERLVTKAVIDHSVNGGNQGVTKEGNSVAETDDSVEFLRKKTEVLDLDQKDEATPAVQNGQDVDEDSIVIEKKVDEIFDIFSSGPAPPSQETVNETETFVGSIETTKVETKVETISEAGTAEVVVVESSTTFNTSEQSFEETQASSRNKPTPRCETSDKKQVKIVEKTLNRPGAINTTKASETHKSKARPSSAAASPVKIATSPRRPTSGRSKTPVAKKETEMSTSVKSRTVSHNAGYKPGGGNVKVYSEKVDVSKVKSRTDSRPKSSPAKPGDSSPRPRTVNVDSSPRTKNVQSKIGSFANITHTPGGGKVQIKEKKVDYSKVASKCGSLEKASHKAGGGNVKIFNEDIDRRSASSRIASLDNVHYSPGGGHILITSEKIDFSKRAKSRVGSLDNASHTPGGGRVKIRDEKVDFKNTAKSKIGSMDNVKHSPSGGNIKITSEKTDFSKSAKSKVGSMSNVKHSPGGGNIKITSEKVDFTKKAKSKVGSMDNAAHSPGGGNVKITNEKVNFKSTATSKVGSLDNADHQPGGGNVEIFDEKLMFEETASSKIGSKDNIGHVPGGGDVVIQNEKVDFSEVEPRTDHGLNSP